MAYMKTQVQTDKAPKAIGPYSQAICANGFVFLSGQIPLDPATGQLVEGSIVEQTRRVLDNIRAVLESEHLSLENVVKTTVFLKDITEFGKMNEIYAQYFKGTAPARSTVEVSRLPRDVQVEIEVIAAA